MSGSLTADGPFPARFKAWLDERFPFANAPAFFLFYLTAGAVAAHATGGVVTVGWTDIVSCLVVWSMFLLLRVLDEHKDYADDVIHHPERVLQRGLITLGHLKVAGAGAMALTLLWSVTRAGPTAPPMLAWAIMMGWAWLMAAEFFCGAWLKQRLLLYALSHMAIMPLVAWWCVTLRLPDASPTTATWLVVLLFFLTGLAFEIGRKTRGPEEEREGVDSYSKIFGTRGSAVVLLGVTVVIAAVITALVLHLTGGTSLWLLGFVAAGTLLVCATIAKFLAAPSAGGRKLNEKSLGLLALLGYGAIIGAVAVSRGITWA